MVGLEIAKSAVSKIPSDSVSDKMGTVNVSEEDPAGIVNIPATAL